MNKLVLYISIILIILVVFINSECLAQTVVLDVDTQTDTVPSSFGKNRLHFLHLFGRFSFTAGKSDANLPITAGNSFEWGVGLLYKLRINNILSFGSTLVYHKLRYSIDSKINKTFPDTILHKNERFRISPLEGDLFTRINFGKRGDHIGTYIDLGWGFNYSLGSAYIYYDDGTNDTDVEVITTGLKELHKGFQHIFLKLGLDRYVFYISYRFDPITKAAFPDFPPVQAGIELGLY